MDRIAAADNLTIEMDEVHWRLVANGAGETRVLVEAQSGGPVRYMSGFARSRRLPEDGTLASSDIQRVVLGWSEQDAAWHLGLLLAAPLAQARGSRWCEIARWPDPDATCYDASATRAGAGLAQIIERPFSRIAPQLEPAPAAAAPLLPEPPLTLDCWTLVRADGALALVRSPGYARGLARRSLWYGLWVIVYIVLIVTNFTSGIAPARPAFLPYLGLLAAAILTALIVRNVYWLWTQPNRIVIDPTARAITALRGKRQRWRLEASALEAVCVSQVAERSRSGGIVYAYGELNLQLPGGRFWFILNIAHRIETLREPDVEALHDNQVILTPESVHTVLQAAGLHIAAALGLSCRDDRRTR
ncbi:MAG: hypothetical protein ACUVSX_15290 [Aggregatilineales bacterium]